jgi:hypothetical protein
VDQCAQGYVSTDAELYRVQDGTLIFLDVSQGRILRRRKRLVISSWDSVNNDADAASLSAFFRCHLFPYLLHHSPILRPTRSRSHYVTHSRIALQSYDLALNALLAAFDQNKAYSSYAYDSMSSSFSSGYSGF